MAYYAIDITEHLFALVEADSAGQAIEIAEQYPWLEGIVERAEVVDSFATKEDVSKVVPLGEFDLEITSDE